MSDSMRPRSPKFDPPKITPAERVELMRRMMRHVKESKQERQRLTISNALARQALARSVMTLLADLNGLAVRPHHFIEVTWSDTPEGPARVILLARPGEGHPDHELQVVAEVECLAEDDGRVIWLEMDGQRATMLLVTDLITAKVESLFDANILNHTEERVPF